MTAILRESQNSQSGYQFAELADVRSRAKIENQRELSELNLSANYPVIKFLVECRTVCTGLGSQTMCGRASIKQSLLERKIE